MGADLMATSSVADCLEWEEHTAGYTMLSIEQSLSLASRLDAFIKSIVEEGAEEACE